MLYRVDGKLENLVDGALFDSHPILSTNRRTIQIVLYSDEIELCNAIGNHIKKHKLLMFYCVIHNLPKQYRSRLAAIHLYTIIKEELVLEYGYDKILETLLKELHTLAEGYEINIANGNLEIQGCLMAYVADTPAAQKAGGFKEGVGLSFRKSRHCEADEDTMQNGFREEYFRPRQLDRHLKQCQLIEEATEPKLKEH